MPLLKRTANNSLQLCQNQPFLALQTIIKPQLMHKPGFEGMIQSVSESA
jgi:hypothetical protein